MVIAFYFFIKNDHARSAFYKSSRALALMAVILLLILIVYSMKTPLTNETTDLFQRITSVFDTSGRNAAIRFDIWHATYKMIKDNFWWGCGLSYFKMNYLNYQGMLLRASDVSFFENHFFARANQAHNEFLQIFSELGVFAFIASIAFVLYFVASLKKLLASSRVRSNSAGYIIVSCLGAGVISVFINSLFGFPLHVLPTAVLLAFILAIIEKLLERGVMKDPAIVSAAFNYQIIPAKINILAVLASGVVFYAMTFLMMPSYIAANVNMKAGLDYLKLEMPEKAMPRLKKAIAINPYSGETRYYLGVCYLQKKEYDLGIMELLQALESESDPNIFSNIGLAYYKIGMYGEALEYLKKALELSPTDIFYLLNAGCAEQRLKNYDSALSYFQKALSYAVTPEAYINVGHVYLLMNMPDKGAAILGEALNKFGRLNPRYSERINYLTGLCMGEMKKFDEGVKYLARAREMTPRNPDYSLNIGLFQIYSGKTAEAELTFKKQLEIDFSGIIAYNLANLYYNSGRFGDSLMILEQLKKNLETSGGQENRLYEETLRLIKLARERKRF
jgi:tetratricopeptide (TPR) repeat protein